MSSNQSLNKIVSLNVISMVILQGITMLSAPIFSRMLNPENYGVFSLYNTWVSVIEIVFGMQTFSVMAAARNSFQKEEIEGYDSSVIWLSTLSFAVFSFVMLLFSKPLASLLKLPMLAYVFIFPHAFGSFCVTYLKNKMTLDFRANINCILSVLIAISTTLMSLILIWVLPATQKFMGRVLGLSLIYFFVGLCIVPYLHKKGKTFYSKKYWGFCVPLSIPIVFHGLSGIVLSQSDKIMLNHFLNEKTVGIYSLAFAFSNILIVIWNALNESWVPFFYDYMQKDHKVQLKEHSANYMELYTVLTVGFMLLAPDVFRLYADELYWEGIELIPVFASGSFFIFLYSFPVNFEFFHKKTKTIAIGTIFAGVINILLNICMIRKDGGRGASAATAIAHGLQFLFHLIIAKHISKEKEFPFSSGFLFFPMFVVIGVAVVMGIVQTRFVLWRWGIGAILGIIELARIIRRKSIF